MVTYERPSCPPELACDVRTRRGISLTIHFKAVGPNSIRSSEIGSPEAAGRSNPLIEYNPPWFVRRRRGGR